MKKLLALSFLLAFVLGSVLVFSIDRSFDAFGGDDSTLTYCQKVRFSSSTLSQCMVEAFGSKWRPVTSLAHYLSYKVFEGNVRGYILLNIGVHALTASLVGLGVSLLLRRAGLERGRTLFPLLASGLYGLLGFSYYNFTQRWGLMEELCVVFTVSMMCVALVRGHDSLRQTAVVVLFALSCLTHERFMALVAFATLFPFFATELSLRRRFIWSGIPWLVVGAYLFIKGPILKAGLLVGTAAQEVELKGLGLWQRMLSVALNILGDNNGPRFLSAYESSLPVFYVALAALLLCVAVVLLCVRRLHRDELGRLVLLFGAALLGLVFAASVCFRVEFRWIVAPWVAFVLWLGALLLYLRREKASLRLAALSCVALVWLVLGVQQSLRIRQNVDHLFFFVWMLDAESFRNCLEKNYMRNYAPVSILLETTPDSTLMRDYFNPEKFHVVTEAEFAAMTELQKGEVVSLRRYYCGWSFESRKGRPEGWK